MANMFPKVFPRENKSGGEKKIFDFFKNDCSEPWYILHSFRLPEHLRVVFGESDFIIIAPKFGIFTIEVKSGGVGFDGTDWLFIDREQKVSKKQRGPFEQARDGMFEIERIINSKTNNRYPRSRYLYGYGVIFTDEDSFPVDAITEDEPWRLMQRGAANDYAAFIKKLATNFKKELSALHKREPMAITEEDAKEIAQILRPEIECVSPIKSFIDYSEEDIIKLTQEQFDCINDIEINERIVILGGAGTGKTLLAIEDAKRSSDAGERVAVFCYNKNLARNIRRSLPNDIDVFSFHSYLTKLCSKEIKTEDAQYDDAFFSDELPELALEKANILQEKYTKIIIDEFQDLCTDKYLKVINAILEGELFEGKFSFYGDFAKQAIFSRGSSLDLLSKYTYFAKKHLSINCRNTKNIGNEMVNVTGYADIRYRLSVSGEPVDYFICDTNDEKLNAIKKILGDLRKNNFSSADIVILSPRKRKDSIVGALDTDKFIVGDIGDDVKSYRALFSTVQAFKGLESKVVIVVDVEDYNDSKLMYVALSRARSKMYVIESSQASKQRKQFLIRRS